MGHYIVRAGRRNASTREIFSTAILALAQVEDLNEHKAGNIRVTDLDSRRMSMSALQKRCAAEQVVNRAVRALQARSPENAAPAEAFQGST